MTWKLVFILYLGLPVPKMIFGTTEWHQRQMCQMAADEIKRHYRPWIVSQWSYVKCMPNPPEKSYIEPSYEIKP